MIISTEGRKSIENSTYDKSPEQRRERQSLPYNQGDRQAHSQHCAKDGKQHFFLAQTRVPIVFTHIE